MRLLRLMQGVIVMEGRGSVLGVVGRMSQKVIDYPCHALRDMSLAGHVLISSPQLDGPGITVV